MPTESDRQEHRHRVARLGRAVAPRPSKRVGRDADRISRVPQVPERILYGAAEDVTRAAREAIAPLSMQQRIDHAIDAFERDGEAGLQALAAPGSRRALIGGVDDDGGAVQAQERDRVRPLVETALRVRRLAAMRQWQADARRRIQEVSQSSSSRAAKPSRDAEGVPALDDADVRTLIDEMSRNAADIAILEGDRREWRAVEEAAREAIRLREETAREVLGGPLDGDEILARAHLQVAHATFMQEGNTPRLREELAAVRQRHPEWASTAYWLARYHLLAGDHAAAREVTAAVVSQPGAGPARARTQIAREIVPLFAATVISHPEETHPSIFYTYQRVFTSDATLNEIASELDALASAELKTGGGIALPSLQRAIDAAQIAAAVAAAMEDEALLAAEQDEIRRDGIGNFKFEDENGGPRVQGRDRRVRRATTIGEHGGQLAALRVAQAEAAASRLLVAQTLAAIRAHAAVAKLAIDALLLWNQANADMRRGRYRQVGSIYASCQLAVLKYLRHRYPDPTIFPDSPTPYTLPMTQEGVYSELVRVTKLLLPKRPVIATQFRTRSAKVRLDELSHFDWVAPIVASKYYRVYSSGTNFVEASLSRPEKIDEKVDAPLLMIALAFAPMGLADAYRLRGDTASAIVEYDRVLSHHKTFQFLSNVIELPYVVAMRAQATVERGDAEYKRAVPGAAAGTLKASDTYREVFALFNNTPGFAEYTRQMDLGIQSLRGSVDSLLGKIETVGGQLVLTGVNLHPLAAKEPPPSGTQPAPVATPAQYQQLATLGLQVPVSGITARTGSVPGAEPSRGPHEPLLTINTPAIASSNPLLWAVLAEANARIQQIAAGLNYLGYRDDFVPPWRFQYLLERARYFAEHAKSAERDYLAFLGNAENEDFREIGAAQAVTLEKSNIRVESARLDQSRFEAAAANVAKGLADFTARNAAGRLQRFVGFTDRARQLADEITAGSEFRIASSVLSGVMGGVQSGAGAATAVFPAIATAASAGALFGVALGPPGILVGAAIGAVVGGAAAFFSSSGAETARRNELALAAEQRQLELANLRNAQSEAVEAARVSQAQLDTAKAGQVVATLQHAAALLRHDFAVENLVFLRERTLNAELWYRLALLVRGLSRTYLRHAMEVAFLAEQAYEFEADRQINVIRFDYDSDETTGLLAGDFLLRDLDSMEHDLIVTHRTREQHVKHVLSLARDFPSALQQLRESGSTVLTVPIEQLERRFPGLFNLRIGSVDVVPIALMDPSRFSLELTYMGVARTRMKNTGAGLPGVSVTSWVPDADVHFPVKLRVSEAQAVVYSGLTRAEEQGTFPFMTGNQRHAFEGLGAAASWHVDMSMRENQVDPRSIADILLVLQLSGYHDPVLRGAVERRLPQARGVLTQHLSAREVAPDAFYEFAQTGRLLMPVGGDLLSFDDQVGRLRNLGVTLLAGSRRAPIGQLAASYLVELNVTSALALEVVTEIPRFTFSANGLTLSATAVVRAGTAISWDFGDGAPPQPGTSGTAVTHTYARPGAYTVQLQVVRDERLTTFSAEAIVSASRPISSPVTAFPQFATVAGAPAGKVRVSCSVGGPTTPALTAMWRLLADRKGSRGATVTFDLAPGRHAVLFTAYRDVAAHIYSRQRYAPDPQIVLSGLQVATNREFDAAGNEIATVPRNALATHLFSRGELLPVSAWTVELRVSNTENAFLQGVSDTDEPVVLLDGMDDVIVAMEYETVPAP